jgi:predicted MFS family arabinose efflux permease
MALLGIAFAALITPLTSSVLSSVAESDEGLASGVNNAASRIAQLAGIALAAGVGSLPSGYRIGLITAAVLTILGAVAMAITVPETAKRWRQ